MLTKQDLTPNCPDCEQNVPCTAHAVLWADRELNRPEAQQAIERAELDDA